ncbi:nuclear body protein SP140-like protein [Microtus oregoni]|uniref:nuclear body protein SP140-like protein n=1 Tax=Microtus oregoni TaxID=111838 RepID=UPI001BB1CB4F|nr:nuclear body protein SP140-like protein [Microtus oregoni]
MDVSPMWVLRTEPGSSARAAVPFVMILGTYEKSIRSDNEEWFTPREFEIRGKLKSSQNWKKSIHCYEWTLKELIEKELLPNPQKKKKKNKYVPDPPKKKRKLENSQQCAVCSQGGNLYPCDSCGKFYHENCHIPPVEDKSGPWSCVFCKIKDQAKFQENQAFHKESEVLKRKMLPEEQLKCELLLLTVYQEPKCCFFIHKPKQGYTFIS